jgi:hypothetical protein
MVLRDELQKRIDKKRSEIAAFEGQVRQIRGQITGAEIYIQALEDTMRLLPKEPVGDGTEVTLRPGTNLEAARNAIRKAGKAMHIGDLLKAMGLQNDDDTRASVSGSLGFYVRKGQVFTRPAPNTFGLVEFQVQALRNGIQGGPPPNFGKDEIREDDPFEEGATTDADVKN